MTNVTNFTQDNKRDN